MSGATSLPGAELFLENLICLNKPLVRGSCAARGNVSFRNSDCFKNMTSTNSKHALSESLGAWFAEQNVGNFKKCTFSNSGTPVRRTRRRKSQKMHFQEFWDSCAQNKTSEISKNALSRTLGIGSLTIILARIWGWGRRGGCAPPHPPASWGAAPPRPPKRRSAPLAAVVGLFSLDRVTCP